MIPLSRAITSVTASTLAWDAGAHRPVTVTEGDLTSPNAVPRHQPVGCVRYGERLRSKAGHRDDE